MYEDNDLLRFYIRLTPRQREVLQLVSQGLTNKQAAAHLCIAPSVVAGYLTTIYETLAADEALGGSAPNRYVLISLYAEFFRRHPLFTAETRETF